MNAPLFNKGKVNIAGVLTFDEARRIAVNVAKVAGAVKGDQQGGSHMAQKVIKDGGLLANSAAIISNAVRSPLTTLIIENKDTSQPQSTSSERFNIILWVVAGITVFCLLAAVGFAVWGPEPPTGTQKEVLQILKDGFKIGLGAFVGLLGGKAMG